MNIWINKCTQDEYSEEFSTPYIMNITNKGDSTIKSDIKDIWFDLGCLQIDSIYEDLYIISLSVFAIDKRFPRRFSKDSWTREIKVSIPVINIEKWNNVKTKWEKMLRFLSGDIWNINFRQTSQRYCKETKKNPPSNVGNSFDCLCLFSGGLDSYCGAIKLLQEKNSVCFVGYKEYPKLEQRQTALFNILNQNYPDINKRIINFTAIPRAPIYNAKLSNHDEKTSRSRSLLFICGALSIANILGDKIPLYIPENGFIGLNIPLTSSRRGSCSTRTTHPYFINTLLSILKEVGINNDVRNFFSYSSKKDVVNAVENTHAFTQGVEMTISCSHPCLPRWKGNEYPINCGYCYPCLIRKSSLKHLNLNNDIYTEPNSLTMDFLNFHHEFDDKASDVRAVLSMVYKNKEITDENLRKMINCTGEMQPIEVKKFMKVYRDTINDLIELISGSDEMKEYLGLIHND